jgi:3-deoxy-manno-octulosonate cytidylyltransferase (CMP-KDO synthetase)
MRHPTPQAGLHAVGVIPARYQSSRFPGKPLALIDGRTLVERVFERARSASRIARLLVATDDERIASAVRAFGGEVVMTSSAHASGTDRLAEVARSLPADLFVNIQGDEPLVDPQDIDRLIECLDSDPSSDMATLADPLLDPEGARNPNVVKVVCDAGGKALYFSRSPIPYVLEGVGEPPAHPSGAAGGGRARPWLRHVGLYAYRRGFLLEFASWSPGVLEGLEGLEQLRSLERGRGIRVLKARGRYLGVDTPDDVRAVEQALRTSA